MVTNITGFLIISRGSSFLERVTDRGSDDIPIKERWELCES